MKRWNLALMVALLLTFIAVPVAAAPDLQEGGGVHFGTYTLAAGDSFSGDLTVFGGPVVLEESSTFDGDLTVFGPCSIREDAEIDGSLVVLGELNIAGSVDGDVFAAGSVSMAETAYVSGDLSAVGDVSMEEGAEVDGDIVPVGEDDFNWDGPIVPAPYIRVRHQHPWLRKLLNLGRAIVTTLVFGVLALVIYSIWPQQTERVARTVEEVPLISFGMGLLLFLLTGLVALVLIVTICLSPLGGIGLIVVGVGTLMGWVALGLALGRQVLSGLLNKPEANPAMAAIVGTMLLTLIVGLTRVVWGPLQTVIFFMLVPPAAGAVVLTRFGSMPYATQGRPVAPAPRAPQSPQSPKKHEPIVPAPIPASPSPPAPPAPPPPPADDDVGDDSVERDVASSELEA